MARDVGVGMNGDCRGELAAEKNKVMVGVVGLHVSPNRGATAFLCCVISHVHPI